MRKKKKVDEQTRDAREKEMMEGCQVVQQKKKHGSPLCATMQDTFYLTGTTSKLKMKRRAMVREQKRQGQILESAGREGEN